MFYFVCPILIKLDFIEKLVYLVWLDLLLFYYDEFIQIANGNLSRFNIVVLQKKCVLSNSILLNLILAMLLCDLVIFLVRCHASLFLS